MPKILPCVCGRGPDREERLKNSTLILRKSVREKLIDVRSSGLHHKDRSLFCRSSDQEYASKLLRERRRSDVISILSDMGKYKIMIGQMVRPFLEPKCNSL